MMATLSGRLRLVRESLMLSQQELAEQCGVTQRTQRSYEAGEHVPDASYLTELARLGGDVMYLLQGKSDDAPLDMPSIPLAADEVELVHKYRAASEELRHAAHRVLQAALSSAGAKPTSVQQTSNNSKNNIQVGFSGGPVKIHKGR